MNDTESTHYEHTWIEEEYTPPTSIKSTSHSTNIDEHTDNTETPKTSTESHTLTIARNS